MQVKVKKLLPFAKLPTYESEGAGCFDLYAAAPPALTITPTKKTEVYGTGLAFEIPMGHVMLIFSRSGHGFKRDIRLANCVGVIDSDYRGEVMVKLRQDDELASGPDFGQFERIAQALILPVEQVGFIVVDELSDTARGANGFGSTGNH